MTQHVSGARNQAVQNSGTVYGSISQTIGGTECAEYRTEQTGYLPIKHFVPRAAKLSIAPVILTVLNVTGGLASILSFFGLTAGGITLVQLATWIVTLLLAIFPLMALRILIGVSLGDYYRFGPWRYELADRFFIRVLKTKAACPISGCSGTLELKKPKPNQEGVELVGICTRRPSIHVFDFDEATHQGSKLHLTFVHEKKQ